MRPIPTFWRFILPLSLLMLIGAAFLIERETSREIIKIEHHAEIQAAELTRLLLVSENLVGEQVKSAMRLLKDRGMLLGKPSIHGEAEVAGLLVPALYLGQTPQTNNFQLVDEVTKLVGGTATLFVKADDNFIRVATNVTNQDGSRALGTILNPHGKAYAAINSGKPFYGVTEILGQHYITGYEPMLDNKGEVIGVCYVGYKVDMKVLREAVETARYLETGFSAVLDDRQQVRFVSSHMKQSEAQAILDNPPSDWVLVRTYIPSWKFEAVVAYPQREARTAGFSTISGVILTVGIVAFIFIAAIVVQWYRLVLRPVDADPALAIRALQKISKGDWGEDGQTASSGTLMSHILSTRTSLREMLGIQRENAERLSLAASVFEHTHDGIFITDAKGRIIEVNSAFTRLTGHSRDEALNNTLYTLNFATGSTEMLEQIWPSLAKTGTWHGESRNLRKNGDAYSAELDIFTVRDNAGEVSHYVGVLTDITLLKQQQEHLKHLAYHDALTQLPNRVLFSDRLQHAIQRIGRSQTLLAVCLLDLDEFKPVNDKLGHEAGDHLLVELAQRLTSGLRAGDTVARIGGDEFALLLCDLNSMEECVQALRRLLAAIATPFKIQGQDIRVSGSMGVTMSPFDDATPDSLLRHADQAMYQAKMAGGNCFHMFDADHDRRARAHREALDEVKAALDRGEFRLFYQPKVDMRRGMVMGAEALVRWQHPVNGLMHPAEFLPSIESTDFSITLGNWVINEALRQMSLWQEEGLLLPVSVNISARHLSQPDFTSELAQHLEHWPKVSAGNLKLEITESTALGDIASVAKVIEACHQLGVSFAVDDFGTGYSSLTYLRHLPAEMLKIDQSFVRDMLVDADDMAIIQGVIGLGMAFNRSVIAEGVESAEHGLRLMQLGCDLGQGYGIARPMPPVEMPRWVKEYKQDPIWKGYAS